MVVGVLLSLVTCTDPPWRSAGVRPVPRRAAPPRPAPGSPHAVPRWLPCREQRGANPWLPNTE